MNNFIGISSLVFCDISIKSNVFINSHGYLKLGICMLNHLVKRVVSWYQFDIMFGNLGKLVAEISSIL